MFKKGGFIAATIFWFEKRSLQAASRILTDTVCNSQYLEKLFSLPRMKLQAIPLATDENNYIPVSYKDNGDICTVLFIGTFVPLHGVETVAKAALLLSDNERIRFRIFGNGQTATSVREILDGKKCNLEWRKEWTDPALLAKEVEKADICLGIFGTTKKASRVWPLKNYTAMRVGRVVINRDSKCIPGWGGDTQNLPICLVPAGDAAALAKKLTHLAKNYKQRKKLADAGKRYYHNYLSNAKILDALHQTMSVLIHTKFPY